jgi:ribonuclease D
VTARYVATPQALAEVAGALRREPRLAVDTEAASFHRYRDRIYLLQVSGRTESALIDPLALADLTPFGALLSDPQIEKVFHDADYDLRVLDRDYQYHAVHLFDTRIAAQLAGEPAIGLAALVEKYVGVKLDKEHQKADWSLRPLPPPMLAYAAADTHYLLALRDALEQRLRDLGRLTWATEEFKQLESLRWTGVPAGGGGDDETYLRLKGAKALGPRSLAALRLLHRWRESVAEREDKAPFRIIGNDALLSVSRALPTSPEELGHVRDLPSSLARRHGAALLDAVDQAKRLPESDLPRLERRARPVKDPGFEVRSERLKAVRNRVAIELGLDPGVLAGRTTLEAVARARAANRDALLQIPELRRWQVEVLGDAFLEALR